MRHKERRITILFCIWILSAGGFSGCLSEENESDDVASITMVDNPTTLPDWQDGDYHDYAATKQMLNEFNDAYPYQVDIFSIGKSVLGREIWCIKITNENNTDDKLSCLIDGCIHGNEWEAGEACLYLADYLLINHATNKTIMRIMNTTEIYIVPLVNPDGREADERFTDNGVDANRNFDVFFGKLIRGHSYRLGKLFGRIKIPVIKIPPDDPVKWYWNCGRFPFSEPETKALSDFIETLAQNDLAFYVNCHTPMQTIIMPWLSYEPPFTMANQENQVYEHVANWIKENTVYDGIMGQKIGAKTGGNVMDWCFKEFRIPSFTLELYAWEYGPYEKNIHVDLVYWMKTTLPFFMYLLMNSESLHSWQTPGIEPLLPEGIPQNSP
jgi:hypothetical protein